ncbi:MAG: DUF1439 domain-containing protein [Lysobacter sp.]|nr:DUF1439 domain-containing protein [Lysobacter sp.]
MTGTRRAFLRSAALFSVAVYLSGCATLNAASALLGNQLVFSTPQLQEYLDRHYPRRYDAAGGLVDLTVSQPQISIPPDSSRLHLDFDVGIDGLGMRSDRHTGHFAITSGLRYDTRSHALYLEEPELESVQLPLLGDRMTTTGRELINGWLRDYARNEPVYRLEQRMLDTLGSRRVSGTLIQDGRVVIKLDR